MTTRATRWLLAVMALLVLAACSPSGPTLSVGEDSSPKDAAPDEAAPDEAAPDEAAPDEAAPDEAAPDEAAPDDPTPTTVDPQEISEYEQFRWQDGVVDGYAMTYTQECGNYLRADEPRTIWVEGPFGGGPVDSTVRANELATIPELLEVIIARHPQDSLEFIEGDIGQPERITITSPEIGRYFCFELINFSGSTKDGEGRMPVPLLYEAYAPNKNATTFGVGAASCNGEPEVFFDQTPTAIIVETVSRIPDGDIRNSCLDGVEVQLDAPIGERDIIDGFTGRTVPLLTDEILEQPQSMQQVGCEDDVPDCRAGFQIGTQIYTITCIGVADEGVTDFNFASGVIDDGTVDAFQIKSVGVNIMVAVNLTSGDCTDRAVGPIAGVEHAWSVAARVGNDPDQLSRFLCSLADLSGEQRAEQRCERFD